MTLTPARLVAAVASRTIPRLERRTFGRKLLRRLPVGRRWLVLFTTGAQAGHVVVPLRRGIFDLDLADDVERALYYRCYEDGELSACLAVVEEGDTVIDVGANVGAYTVPLARTVGSRGSVHAFEPMASVADRLSRNCALSRCQQQVKVNRVALSDATGTAEFFDAGEGHSGWGSLEQFADVDFAATTTTTTSLDDYVRSNSIPHARLVKIDVEGHDLSVIQGARKILSDGFADYLLVEGNEKRLRGAGHSTFELVDTVTGLGFVLQNAWPRLRRDIQVDTAEICCSAGVPGRARTQSKR